MSKKGNLSKGIQKMAKYTVILALILISGKVAIAQTEIRTAEELAAIGANKNSLEGSYILLNDIMVDNWIPVGGIDGSNENGFTGVFDGNGHTVTINGFNLELDNTRVGLFGLVGGKGIVKNLRVAGKVNYTCGQKFLYIGGIAGINSGMITACVSSIDLTCNYAKAPTVKKAKSQFGYEFGQFGGGFAGINLGVIIHCYSTGSIHVFQGQAAGIACVNGRPIKGSIGVSVGPGGGGIAVSSGAIPMLKGGVAYCYSTAAVSSVVDNTGRGLRIISGGAGGIVASNRLETAAMNNCVALNRWLEAKGNTNSKASPFPIYGSAGLTIAKSQFHYREDILTRRYNASGVELEPEKISPKCAVALSTTQEESWWRLPDGLTKKEQQTVLGFPFGENEAAPWKWNEKLKRPVLYWETDMPEEGRPFPPALENTEISRRVN